MSTKALTADITLERAIVHHPMTVSPTLLVSEAITLMSEMAATCDRLASEPGIDWDLAEARASCLVIVEATQPIGLLTARDVVRLSASGQPCLSQPISEVVTTPIFSIHPDASPWQAQSLMDQKRLSYLVVISDREDLMGIITRSSLQQVLNPLQIYQLAQTLEQKVCRLEAEKRELQQNRTAELEHQIQQRTIELQAKAEQAQTELAAQQRREQEIQLLDAIIQSVSEVDDFDAALGAILGQICKSTHWSFGEAWVPAADQSCLQLSPSWYSKDPTLHPLRDASAALSFGPNQGIPGRVWVSQQPEWIQDVSEQTVERFWRVEAVRKIGLKAVLSVPILAKHDVVAVLLFFATEPYQQDSFLLQLLSSVTAQVGQIIRRKQAEAALKESEARFQAFMNNSPSASWITDRDGRVFYLSGTYLRTFQLPTAVLDDWIGTTVFEMYPAEIAQQFVDNIREVAAMERVLETIEKAPRPDGTLGDFLVYKFPLQGIAGQQLVGGVAIDVTERVRAEHALQQLNQELETRVSQRTAALQESEERLRQIFDQSPIGIAISDLEGHLTRVNSSLAAMMGCSASEMLQRSIQDFLPIHEQQNTQPFQQLLEQPHAVSYVEQQSVTQNGQVRWVTVTSTAVFNAVGQPSDLIYLIEDITDRKQIEEQLRNSEKHLCAAQRIAHLGSWEFDLLSQEISWSQETYQIFGRNLEDGTPSYEAALQLIHPDDRDQHDRVFQQAIEQKQSFDLEFRLCRVDGTLCHVHVRGEPILDAENQPIRFVGTILDITQRKQAEEALANYAHKVEDLYNNAPCGYHSLDNAGRWVKINNTELNWLGYTREEILGKSFAEFLTPESQQIFQAGYFTFKQRGWVRDIEYDMIRKDGTILPVLLNATTVLSDDGTYLYSRSTLFDIRDRKAAEVALKRQLAAIEAAIEGITILQDETYTYLNQAHLKLFGYQCTEELIGKSWKTLYSSDEQRRFEQEIFPSLRQRGCWQGEATATRKDGSTFIQGLSLTLTESGALICVCRNISEQKQTEKQLQRMNAQLTLANAELHRATRLKDEFLANMSHELRTPLNAVLGMSEALQEGVFGELTDRQQRAIQTIERSGKHLLELINDILDLSKVEAGKLELQAASVSVRHLCESSLPFIRHQAIKKNLQLQTEIPAGLPDIVVDERRMRQVLINLLSNAVKFTPAGGSVKLVVQTELHQGHHCLCFSVIDTGIGIAQADVSHLFQPFVQIDSRLNRQYTGTGLGLALVSKLVELHRGSISVTSQLGRGSCFTVCLPYLTLSGLAGLSALQSDAATAPLTKHSQNLITQDLSAAIEPMPGGRASRENTSQPSAPPLILLAEDNAVNIATISSYLTARGYRLILAKSGQEAVMLTQSAHPDLILMDIQMPGMDGLEAMRQIRADPQFINTPIFALTALAMPGDREKCAEAGANFYFTKPVKLKQLVGTIQQFLAQN